MKNNSIIRRSALAIGAITTLSTAIYAGSSNVATPKPAAAASDAPTFGLTGDWGGVRTSLFNSGISISSNYTGEFISNVSGGKARGGILEGLFKLSLDVNLEKAVGWQGATFRVSTLTPHGSSPSAKFVGDSALVSNIDANDALRLVDLWLEQRILEDKISIKIGQMRVDDEFGVTDTAGMFLNSNFGVPSIAAPTMPVPNYPVGALGVRVRVEPIKGLYGQVGLYDGNSSPSEIADPTNGSLGRASRHGTDWAFRSSEGVLWATEVGYQRCCDEYPGAIRLGFLHHTDETASLKPGDNPHSYNNSGYFVIDQTIWQKSGAPKEGLSAFLRGITSKESRNVQAHSVQLGTTFTGIATSDDKLGVAWARTRFSRYVAGIPSNESILELTYQYPVNSYLKVQPDIQYVRNPGQNRAYSSAWVAGVRAVLEF